MILDYRFRNEDGLVVLQVCEQDDYDRFSYNNKAAWRDAKTEDLLNVADLMHNRKTPCTQQDFPVP
jgi:hypothetical protein